VFRKKEFVAGAIYFCYNDYRSHMGPTGVGALRQNVHGVVDLFGRRKPSYAALRDECSPVESLTAENRMNAFQLRLKTRQDIPMYALRGYKVRGIFYGEGDVPVERQEVELAEIVSGGEATVDLKFSQSGAPVHVTFDVLRPTGFSAYSTDWKP
jgi:beta-glucuronidase